MAHKFLIIRIVFILIFINIMINPETKTDNIEETVIRTIAIFPISNQNDNNEYNYLSYTIRDALKAQLSPSNQFLFSDFSGIDNELKKINLNNKTVIDEKAIKNICLKLKANIAVSGKFEIIENKITIYLNALDISLNKTLASTSINGDVGLDIFRIVNDVSISMADKMAKKIIRFGPFSENFDSVALGERPKGWSINMINEKSVIGTVNAPATQPVSTPNCLKIHDGSRTGGAGINIFIQEANYGQLIYKIKLASSPDMSHAGMILKDSSSKDIINVLMDDNNRIGIKNPDKSTYTYITYYNRDTWLSFQINWDRITGYFKIFINNVDYGTYPIMASGNIYRISFFSGSTPDSNYYNSTAYIDNLVYTTDTIPIIKP